MSGHEQDDRERDRDHAAQGEQPPGERPGSPSEAPSEARLRFRVHVPPPGSATPRRLPALQVVELGQDARLRLLPARARARRCRRGSCRSRRAAAADRRSPPLPLARVSGLRRGPRLAGRVRVPAVELRLDCAGELLQRRRELRRHPLLGQLQLVVEERQPLVRGRRAREAEARADSSSCRRVSMYCCIRDVASAVPRCASTSRRCGVAPRRGVRPLPSP